MFYMNDPYWYTCRCALLNDYAFWLPFFAFKTWGFLMLIIILLLWWSLGSMDRWEGRREEGEQHRIIKIFSFVLGIALFNSFLQRKEHLLQASLTQTMMTTMPWWWSSSKYQSRKYYTLFCAHINFKEVF